MLLLLFGVVDGSAKRKVGPLAAGREQAQEAPSESTLYFPDYVDGGGWSVQLALSNVDANTAAEVVVEVYDQDGQPVPELFDSESTFEIPSLGSRVLRSAGAGPIQRGWIQVESDLASVSGLLTYRHSETGVEVGVGPGELGSQFALFVEESPAVGAGVAIFKPDAFPSIELRIRDEEGSDPLERVFVPWRDFHQAARTLPEWFEVEGVDTGFLTDFRGLLFLRTEDGSPFAPLGLRFGKVKGKSSLSAVPAIRNQTREPVETTLYFPDYVDGGGWSVQLALSNVDANTAAEVVVEVYDEDGQPVPELFDSESTFEIPSLGNRVLRSAGAGQIRRGWIQIESDLASVSGLLTYRHSETGIEVGVESVELGSQFALFVEESRAVGAGVAIFKPDSSPRIELRIRDEEGSDPLEGVFVPWRDSNQAARTLPEWFEVEGVDTGFLTDFRGLLFLRTEDGSPFAPLGLRFGKLKGKSSLSAVPAIRITEGGGIDGGHAPPPTVTLSASPKSIDQGQSTTLTWSSTNAKSAEITPGIGVVPTSGSRKVSPNVTTTYRITVTVTVTVAVSERAALVALYEVTGGPQWTNNGSWLTDAPLGEWYGVDTDASGRVVRLDLSGRWDYDNSVWVPHGLRGPIPPELGNLSSLRELGLSINALWGPIPSELGSLSNLKYLYLSINDLTGPIPPELGSLSNLGWLYLSGNDLTGPIPPELGSLSNLRSLRLIRNDLTGPIPRGLLQLDQLSHFYFSGNEGLCAPGTAAFVNWLQGIERHEGPFCNESDIAALESLYEAANGEDWTNSGGWLTDAVTDEWYGVSADSLGRVQTLDLSRNNLAGLLTRNLDGLAHMTELRIGGNALTGRLPLSLARLSLRELHYADTQLCAPAEESFRAWLNAVPSHQGTGVECARLSDRDILVALYEATGGPNWTNNGNWLTVAPLRDWYGVSVDGEGRVVELKLSLNRLTGRLPLELGSLSNLNGLFLNNNDLTGPVPPELASLSNLQHLWLSNNDLTGPIPPELGNLSSLKNLFLDRNALAGPVPPELGRLASLRELGLAHNAGLSGALPASLTALRRLEALVVVGTDLCAPSDAGFQAWLEGVRTRRVALCASGGVSMAYLTQAVQSREFPVPLVAGEPALLRAFVTAARATGEGIPPVRARFYLGGGETHVADIPGQSGVIPGEVFEGNPSKSANAEIPGRVVQPGLEMVIEVDPEGTLDPALGVTKRIPETGRMAIDVRAMPVFDLTSGSLSMESGSGFVDPGIG